MLVLGLDLETSGLAPESDEIIEIGAVLWDVERAYPLKVLSVMVKPSAPLDSQVTQITGLTSEDLERWGITCQEALKQLSDLAQWAECIVAHNGLGFDKKFLEVAWKECPDFQVGLPWVDTMYDLPFSENIGTRKLDYLAAEHGFLNPFSHRALFDVLTMLKILSNYSFADVLQLSRSPLVKVVAQVSFEEKDKAKELGFRWDPKQRVWYSEMKQVVFERKRSEYPFSTVLI